MNVRRILVVRLGAMGDIIHTLPAVASLKRSFVDAHITWAMEPRWPALVEGNPDVDEILPIVRTEWRGLVQTARKLYRGAYDLVVDFQGLIKSALVTAFTTSPNIYGWHRSVARESWAARFYTGHVIPKSAHVVDRNLELVAASRAHDIVRTFWIPKGDPEGRLPDAPFVLANPLAGWGSKQWPMENYLELARRIGIAGYRLVLNAPHAIDAAEVHVHVSGIPGLIDATRRAAAVVGLDSGPLHLAAALGKPGVAIFGPTDPARNGPYGQTMAVLRAPEAITSYKRRRESDNSMMSITVEQVWAALAPQLP